MGPGNESGSPQAGRGREEQGPPSVRHQAEGQGWCTRPGHTQHNFLSRERAGASALGLPPSPAFLGQAGQGLWELRGSGAPGARWRACQSPEKVPDRRAERAESFPTLPTPERVVPWGSPPCSCPANLSPAPLGGCQQGCSVLMGTRCPDTSWAQLAQCQASQESSNRALSPTPVCPESPNFLEQAAPLAPACNPRPDRVVGLPSAPTWPDVPTIP